MDSISPFIKAQDSHLRKLQLLDEIETKIIDVLQMAGNALTEFDGGRPSFARVKSGIESFMTTLLYVEKRLTDYVTHLSEISTLQPYEGSDYGPRKDFQMTMDRSRRAAYLVYELTLLSATHRAQNAKHTSSDLPR